MKDFSLQIRLPDWLPSALPATPLHSDTEAMQLALALARRNVLENTGGPFGAVIVDADSGQLLGAGVNRVVPEQNSCLHAEITAFMFAQHALGVFSLAASRTTLYSSCAPCAMCLGATLWSGVTRVVISARREDAAAIGFDEGPVFPESWTYLKARGIRVDEDVQLDEGRTVLQLYAQQGGLIYNGDVSGQRPRRDE